MTLAGSAVPKGSAERSGIGRIVAFIIGKPGLRGCSHEFTSQMFIFIMDLQRSAESRTSCG
ncbi:MULTISPECIES: hypothetical protein [unclassified Paracoccus (in: a-proteobacteria)]|uniref:hypothetical protein n=1 Tax=unclassified Paracoccus (in: a-proteobacteria) TaxID=2688777 RepID=UPI0016043405|nr:MULTISPECIES: hypothetical protein [unclassified Paracoccus (in: a-proteobacteria)]MBB1492597.1 hypothetical protein [Paracoccus sp. MC1854]MBB1499142.1 hypothetical protein [Paracoccus sp. MC1862]QQO46800.1 hypothetical protein JGR78_17810 [Paracoccus sp. MC1862]